MRRAGRWLWVGLLLLVLVAAGCSRSGQSPKATSNDPAKIKVTTTIGMITDLARRIGGEHVVVDGLMGPGTDPHLYKARERDIRLLSYADVVFYNGIHLEGKLGDVLKRLARKKPVIPVAESIDPSRLLETATAGKQHDPHVWFDVSLWMTVAQRIADGLIQIAPAHRTDFERNVQTVLAELEQLHRWCAQQIATIPENRRVLITAHDAFGYFGRAYGIKVRGVQGISTEDEAGVKEINELVAFIAKQGIRAVFVESSVPKKNVEALIEGVRSRGHQIAIGGELFSDAMGAEATPEGTYVGMVRHNVNHIVTALR